MVSSGASGARPRSPLFTASWRTHVMSICSLAALASVVCVAIICIAGCNKQDVAASNSVQHGSAWQRQAGQSPQAAANIMKQSEKNTKELNEAIASNKTDTLAMMQGKLVRMDGEVADQSNSSWTMKKDGWTIVAHRSEERRVGKEWRSRWAPY